MEEQVKTKRVKYGGRKAGTPNKVTKKVKECITDILTDYTNSQQFKDDFDALDPKDRITAAEKFAQYIVPKLQSAQVDMQSATNITIEDKLKMLAAEEEQ